MRTKLLKKIRARFLVDIEPVDRGSWLSLVYIYDLKKETKQEFSYSKDSAIHYSVIYMLRKMKMGYLIKRNARKHQANIFTREIKNLKRKKN